MERFTHREGETAIPEQFPGYRRPHASAEEVPLTQEVGVPEEALDTPLVEVEHLQEEVLHTPEVGEAVAAAAQVVVEVAAITNAGCAEHLKRMDSVRPTS